MTPPDLQVQEKQEQVEEKGEKTEVGRFFVPQTDVYESADALSITMDMPGVQKDRVSIDLDKNVLTVTGRLDFSNYEDLKPIYTEYNVGNFTRSFSLSNKIDKEGISARMEDGVLELHLPKVQEAAARKIEVQ
ncbi:Hsp20/alpha crystallin family protein [Pseudomonadota bacterium]